MKKSTWLPLLPLLPLASAYASLSPPSLRLLTRPNAAFDLPSGSHLAPLLHPRVPGTPGSAAAQAHISSFFATNLPRWTLTWHNATSTTPVSAGAEVPFANMVFRRDPPGAAAGDVERLTLAAHYDSLATVDGFVGAVDSAAACAMLMRMAEVLEPGLERMWEGRGGRGGNDGLEPARGLQIVFFDGEEAWKEWSDEDSLYGSRALAEQWESTLNSPQSLFKTPIESMSLLVLLDLLGAPNPSVPSYFASTHWAYQDMARVEALLREHALLETPSASTPDVPFLRNAETPTHRVGRGRAGSVMDDHVPFLERGVNVVHLMPAPFPWAVWHKIEDDGDHLDLGVVRDWTGIVAGWVGGWMELEGYIVWEEVEDEYEKVEL